MTATLLSLATSFFWVGFTQAGERMPMPRLAKGLELVYKGSYAEESLIPGVQLQRQFRLENTVFVLDAGDKETKIAVQTILGLREMGVNAADSPPAGAGAGKSTTPPQSVRLQMLLLDSQGNLASLDRSPLASPIDGPPTLECGFVANLPPTAIRKQQAWEVSVEGRPVQTWIWSGNEVVEGVTCMKLTGTQQSEDWTKPRADATAWRRVDHVWLSPMLGVAQKTERIVELRDPAREQPTKRLVVRTELQARFRYPGQLYQDREKDLIAYATFRSEANALAKAGGNTIRGENLARKVDRHLKSTPVTPFRPALTSLLADLENNGRRDVLNVSYKEPVLAARPLTLGDRVPDFVVTNWMDPASTRMQRLLGAPVIIAFVNPLSETSQKVLQFVKDAAGDVASKPNLLVLGVTPDVGRAKKIHAELKLPYPIHDGNGMRQTFGVDATPRIVLVDADGVVRFVQTGWGDQTADEIRSELRRISSSPRRLELPK